MLIKAHSGVVLAAFALLTSCGTASLPSGLPQINLPDPFRAPAETLSVLAISTPVQLLSGQEQRLTIAVGGQPAQPGQLTWTTSDAGVATVNQSGALIAQGVGQATIRAALTSRPNTYLDLPIVVTDRASVAPFALRVLELTNAARARGHTCGGVSYPAAPPLTFNPQLQAAAQAHAADMAARNYFNHITPEGQTLKARITATGYPWLSIAENIAAGLPSPEEVVTGWLDSAGHCQSLMSTGVTELGVGYAYASGSTFKHYWVQNFGRR